MGSPPGARHSVFASVLSETMLTHLRELFTLLRVGLAMPHLVRSLVLRLRLSKKGRISVQVSGPNARPRLISGIKKRGF